tara:strand:- start:191 stop:1543 length:1353 start_codon:yes stop_codon:yes gene_type:complete
MEADMVEKTHVRNTDEQTEYAFPPATLAWLSVAVLLIMGLMAFLDRQIIALLVDSIKLDLGVSDFQVSLLQGLAFGILYATAGLPLGYAVDRYSRRWVIFWGVMAWSICAMLCGLSETYGTLLAARIGVGLGEAALGPAAYSILSDLFPKKRLALALSVYSIGSLLGASVAYAIGGAVVTWAAHGGTLPLLPDLEIWQIAFVVTGFPGILIAFLVFAMPEPKRRHLLAAEAAPLKAVFAFMGAHARFIICLIGGSACMMVCAYAGMSWTAVILHRVYGWSIATVGMSLGAWSAVLGVFGLLMNGALVDLLYTRGVRDAHLRYYVYGMGIIAFAAPVILIMPFGALGFLLAMAPVKILGNFIGVSAAALQIATPAELRGRMSAVFIASISIAGLTIGPSFPAFLTDFVFQDQLAVKKSLAATYIVFAPLGAAFFFFGMKPFRSFTPVETAR